MDDFVLERMLSHLQMGAVAELLGCGEGGEECADARTGMEAAREVSRVDEYGCDGRLLRCHQQSRPLLDRNRMDTRVAQGDSLPPARAGV